MGKQRLALLTEQRLAVTEQRQPHIAQREPHHPAARRVWAYQTAQAGLGRYDGVPRLPRQLAAAAVTAGGRVADATGGKQGAVSPQRLAPVGDGPLADAILYNEFFRTAAHKFCIIGVVPQRRQHIRGAVALGNTRRPRSVFSGTPSDSNSSMAAADGKAYRLEYKKTSIVPHIGQKFPHIVVACDVATSFSCDKQLLTGTLGVVLQHRHGQPAGAGCTSRHQPGCTAADDQ